MGGGGVKNDYNKTTTVFFPRKRIATSPLNFSDALVHFIREDKYIGVCLDSALTWRKHIECNIRKLYKAKNDLDYLLYVTEIKWE